MSTVLQVENVNKSYGENIILDNISLQVASSKVLTITGNSGAGKTTLLSILGLLQKPDNGSIFVDGQQVDGLKTEQQAKVRGANLGFVFQKSRLVNSLSVLENVLVPQYFSGTKQDIEKRAVNLLEELGLAAYLGYKPFQLSVGQARRVALARALLLKPKILLADEPTNDLDPELALAVINNLKQAADEGSAVIIVTHDYNVVKRADEKWHLQLGKLVQPEESFYNLYREM